MRRSARFALLALVPLCTTAVALWLAQPRSLLARATRVGSYRRSAASDLRRASILLLQLATRERPRAPAPSSCGVRLSLPDGRVLLWPYGFSVPPNKPVSLVPGRWPSGAAYIPAPSHWQPATACGAGTSGWVALLEFRDGWHILRYAVDGPQTLTDVPVGRYPFQRASGEPVVFIAGSTNDEFPRVGLGLRRNGMALTAPMALFNIRKECVILASRVGDNPADASRIRLRLPSGGIAREITLSDQGDRLAWLVSVHDRGWAPPWVRRLLPANIAHGSDSVELWVGDSDGSRQHMVAAESLPLGVVQSARAGSAPGRLCWTPDGKRVSFLYEDGMYTVPAD